MMTLTSFLALAIATLTTSASTQATEVRSPAPPEVRLYAMNCGEGQTTDAGRWADDGSHDGEQANFVVSCYLIRHPKGDLMWESGLPEGLADVPGGDRHETVTVKVQRKLTALLATVGMKPTDVEYLSVSHSHHDHIGNGNLFAGSTWIVHENERALAFSKERRSIPTLISAYSGLENAKTLLLKGEANHDVFGDGSVTIVPASGHTPGHALLLVRLPQAGPVLLTGDLWILPDGRAKRLVPRHNSDRTLTLASMDRAERIVRETGARVVSNHVRAHLDAMPAFPAYLR